MDCENRSLVSTRSACVARGTICRPSCSLGSSLRSRTRRPSRRRGAAPCTRTCSTPGSAGLRGAVRRWHTHAGGLELLLALSDEAYCSTEYPGTAHRQKWWFQEFESVYFCIAQPLSLTSQSESDRFRMILFHPMRLFFHSSDLSGTSGTRTKHRRLCANMGNYLFSHVHCARCKIFFGMR